MKLIFLGIRGEIEAQTARHHRHSALVVSYCRRRVMVDCGAAGETQAIAPHAIVLTHAHPDHAWGLNEGAPGPVYATAETWQDIADYPIAERHRVEPRAPLTIEGISFEAFPVEHSTRCPAVGYRIGAGRVQIFYSPDLAYIHDRGAALTGVALYIGGVLSKAFSNPMESFEIPFAAGCD